MNKNQPATGHVDSSRRVEQPTGSASRDKMPAQDRKESADRHQIDEAKINSHSALTEAVRKHFH